MNRVASKHRRGVVRLLFLGAASVLALIAAVAVPPVSAAQPYPSKPITIVVPFAPGGYSDVVARLLARTLPKELGQPVIVENRPGAGATIGTAYVAKATPDGYTVAMVAMSYVLGPLLYRSVAHDPFQDFVPVARLVDSPSVLVVHPAFQVRSVADLIALAKARPHTIDYASSGNGSTQHLLGALFASSAGIEMNHIPYRGSSQALNDVLGGQVKLSFVSLPNALAHIQSGRLRALAVTADKRLAELPAVPTLLESGMPGFEVAGWLGMVAPARTPPDIVMRLQRAMATSLGSPEAAAALKAAGVQARLSNGADFGRLLRAEQQRWGKVITQANIKLE